MIGSIAAFHVTVCFLTQLFHVFNYPVIFILNIGFIVSLYYLSGGILNKKSWSVFKDNWFVFLVLVVIILQLVSIRFSYTGPVQTMRGTTQVENSNYPYPYFSDEWVNVSLIKYCISNHSLSTVNPLYHDVSSPNILFIFTGTISEFFVLTGLDPLTAYAILQMLVVLAICISFYILLRYYGISMYIAAVTVIGFMYITNSGNLPAMWSLLPVTLSALFLPWIILAQKHNMKIWAMVYSLFALIIYPPMLVFVVPILGIELYTLYVQKSKKEYMAYLIKLSGIGLGAFIVIFSVAFFHFHVSIGQFFSRYIVRSNLDFGIPDYSFWHVLPVLIILCSLCGIYVAYKKKYSEILIPTVVGGIFWIMYLFTSKVFIIEYPRVVFITSIFLVVLAGFGIEYLVSESIRRIHIVKVDAGMYRYVGMFILVLYVVLLATYPTQASWQGINSRFQDSQGSIHIIPPANILNRYLQDDDMKIFKDIHEVNFISIPWKALVVGSATHNFPLESKSSTISSQIYSFAKFMNLNCAQKAEMAGTYKVAYVYSGPFSCPNFKEVTRSGEGFVLYSSTH